MRIRLLSDLHFEFHRDGGKGFVQALDPRGVDLLVLAGDITKMKVGFDTALGLFRRRFDCPIVYVHGNHEFYEATRETVVRATKDAVSKLPGVHWLDNSIVEIDGHRILGTPLWYGRSRPPASSVSTEEEWANGWMRFYDPKKRAIVGGRWSDFECCSDWADWVYDEHRKAQEFLLDNVREGDIVVSHMLPSRQCVHPNWERSLTNCFFVSDMTPFIADSKAALWLFGHTHETLDLTIGTTRLVSNPFGYVPRGINPHFIDDLAIETPR